MPPEIKSIHWLRYRPLLFILPTIPGLVFLLYMPHQAALALDLASGQLVFAPLVGVAAGLEFDSDGCAA